MSLKYLALVLGLSVLSAYATPTRTIAPTTCKPDDVIYRENQDINSNKGNDESCYQYQDDNSESKGRYGSDWTNQGKSRDVSYKDKELEYAAADRSGRNAYHSDNDNYYRDKDRESTGSGHYRSVGQNKGSSRYINTPDYTAANTKDVDYNKWKSDNCNREVTKDGVSTGRDKSGGSYLNERETNYYKDKDGTFSGSHDHGQGNYHSVGDYDYKGNDGSQGHGSSCYDSNTENESVHKSYSSPSHEDSNPDPEPVIIIDDADDVVEEPVAAPKASPQPQPTNYPPKASPQPQPTNYPPKIVA